MAPGSILELLPKVADAIGAVAKDRQASMGSGGSFAFRGIDDLYNAVHGALVAQGVVLRPNVVEHTSVDRERLKDGRQAGMSLHVTVTVDYEFLAPDGSSIVIRMVGEALDTGDKATQKALSAALKTCLIQTFTIPTEDVAKGDGARPSEVGGKTTKPAPVGYDRTKRSRHMMALYNEVGIGANLRDAAGKLDTKGQREARLEHARHVTGRSDLRSSNDLSEDEMEAVIRDLEATRDEFITP